MAQRDYRISQFTSGHRPEGGVRVQVLCEDHVGTYQLPFLCVWAEDGWLNAETLHLVEADIVGWRMPNQIKRA